MTDQMQRPALLSTSEAADYLNVPVRWVQEAVRQPKVRCARLGKHVRLRVEHLDRNNKRPGQTWSFEVSEGGLRPYLHGQACFWM